MICAVSAHARRGAGAVVVISLGLLSELKVTLRGEKPRSQSYILHAFFLLFLFLFLLLLCTNSVGAFFFFPSFILFLSFLSLDFWIFFKKKKFSKVLPDKDCSISVYNYS